MNDNKDPTTLSLEQILKWIDEEYVELAEAIDDTESTLSLRTNAAVGSELLDLIGCLSLLADRILTQEDVKAWVAKQLSRGREKNVTRPLRHHLGKLNQEWDRELARLHILQNARTQGPKPTTTFVPGSPVKALAGAFAGFSGTVTTDLEHGQLGWTHSVKMSIFGRATPVRLRPDQLTWDERELTHD